MKQLVGQHVLILGLGLSGLAMARWCTRCGAQVSVWDSRANPPQAAALLESCPAAQLRSGDLTPDALQGLQWLLKSPGLAPHDPHIAALWQAAQACGVRTGGELDLFTLALRELKIDQAYAPQVVAITGTNGKTTTTALTTLLAQRAGRFAVAAGNIGPTLLDTLSTCLDAQQQALKDAQEEAQEDAQEDAAHARAAAQPEADAARAAADPAAEGTPPEDNAPAAAAPAEEQQPRLPQVWVLELSSFQLADLAVQPAAEGGFDPAVAVVLNLTQDHLDWHGDMAAYGAAKARIYGTSATMVINRDDPAVLAMEPALPSGKQPKGAPKAVARNIIRYGLDAPQRPGDFGLVQEGGMAWLVRALPADETIKRRKGDDAEEIHLQRLMPADALRLRGRHNAGNALAALALATAIGCPLAPMLHGLREYRGEPHRVEFVARIQDVEAFDDTKGTNVGATVAALRGLGAERAPAKLVLILGGDGKGQDFSPLLAPVAQHVRAVALIGRDAPLIRAALAASGVPMVDHSTLETATAWCFEQAHASDAVLLSPACASLDMFRNYLHRGEVFVQAVQALAAERGELSV